MSSVVKSLYVASVFSLIIVCARIIPQRHSKIVFCDVGQGDSIYIRTQSQIDILIDAGPKTAVTQCLGSHMPFWDKHIEIAVITHPQQDHIEGYIGLLDSYHISLFIMPQVNNPTRTFSTIVKTIKKMRIPILYADSRVHIALGSQAELSVLWPLDTFIRTNLPDTSHSNELITTKKDLNRFSAVLMFRQQRQNILLTGDIPADLLGLISPVLLKADLLKVPHHGSSTGLTKPLIQAINPSLAVISVGKDNKYGHPSPVILTYLEQLHISYRRTDKEGDILLQLPEDLANVEKD